MSKRSIRISYKKRSINIAVIKTGFFRTGLGLMFRTRNTDNLLFAFSRDGRYSITSWFVFFPFVALWLDKNNRVIEVSIVKPFVMSFKPAKKYRKLIELPISKKNLKLLRFFVGNKKDLNTFDDIS